MLFANLCNKWIGQAGINNETLKGILIPLPPLAEQRRIVAHLEAVQKRLKALKAGISWFLGPENWDSLTITFVSDAKDRTSRPDQGWMDNFKDYLPYRSELDAFLRQVEGKSYPSISLALKLQDSVSDDLLQLCDVLLGATQVALAAGSNQPTKREIGAMVVRWSRDMQKPPWKQQFNLHRRFKLWGFPDNEVLLIARCHCNFK